MTIEEEATRRGHVPGSEGRVGEVLAGKYRLEELLGAGAMGQVYRAVNQRVGRAVAIKLLRAEHAENPIVVERFMREARAANLVRHKNVVDVLDIDRDSDGHPFIVQELLDGEDLARHVARRGGKLPLEDVVETMCPVIEAVAEAHAKGVVHRDIKPENVFLARVGKEIIPKLLDFGISKVRAPDLRATEIGITMGTPAYMAPEQVQGARDADPRSDVWALGIMLFELISGRLPFDETDAPALFVAIATKDAPPLVAIDPSVPASVSKLVARCLRRLPQERYPTASEVARDLRLVMIGEELEPTGKLSVPPSMRVPDLVTIPRAPIAATIRHDGRAAAAPARAAIVKESHTQPSALDESAKPRLKLGGPAIGIVSAPSTDPSLAGDTAPSASGLEAATHEEELEPPSLDIPRPRPPSLAPTAPKPAAAPTAKADARPSPAAIPKVNPNRTANANANADPDANARKAPAAGRLAAGAALPGVMLPAGGSVTSRRTATKEDWGLAKPKTDGPDMSWAVGSAVVGAIVIAGIGGLMQVAHRPEGWPLIQFLMSPPATVTTVVQAAMALVAAAIGVTNARRGVRHWRGELAGGPPAAILNALVAAAVFFAAVELASAAW